MEKYNTTKVQLIGFPGPYIFRITFFLLIFIVYCGTICGNLMVIILVSSSRNLHTPMYFFLTQLTATDIIVTTDIVPNMFYMLLNNGSSLSLPGCITQLFFFTYPECAECLLLTVMSYDRYLAICKPLSYHSIMTSMLCLKCIITSWLVSLLAVSIGAVYIGQLPFCRLNVIDHFFCDLEPVFDLSCSDTYDFKMLTASVDLAFIMLPFSVIVVSYACIIHTILKIQSINQREKAFSTCGSHLAVVSIFYGTLFTIYVTPINRKSAASHKILSLMYCVVTPLINPAIYCLRNKDIKNALRKFIAH